MTALASVISNWRTALVGKGQEIRAKYATTRTAGELTADLAHWHGIAVKFASIGRDMSTTPTTPLNIQKADENAAQLAYLRGYVGQLPAGQLVTRADLVRRSVDAMVAPIDWLIMIGTPALQRSAEYGEMVKRATDAPSMTLKWFFEQVAKSLKLPTWFVPVLATGAVLGVGAWAYFTFLAPVTRSVRLVRRNPRRRRRRVRR